MKTYLVDLKEIYIEGISWWVLRLLIPVALIIGVIFLGARVADHFFPIVEAQSTPTLELQSLLILEGTTGSTSLVLANSPEAVSGFDILVSIEDNGTARITGAQTGLGIEIVDIISPTSIRIRAADLASILPVPPGDITLTTINFEALTSFGVSAVTIVLGRIDSDTGTPISPTIIPSTIKVTRPFPTIPGQTNPVADLDGDGTTEDLNGNGRQDFLDIVLLFTNLGEPVLNTNLPFFDFNGISDYDTDGNEIISFDDVIAAFDQMFEP